ncbi:helix-turn-helix transcriptional regulator [Streptomyces sp. TRM 70361]|uniref:helix-turn-helix transcriptional regulator n=1 Tax=Streptomyces sp. TRM 70361 TaxID=3116553 RepID=UPI002E7C13A5|nr:helix-turn-helix transcriptional regulator [Streptomyces sp. TRM 70361]MEE1943020.1 helix-turn-helix transcriptional regulator [Streptomyces sp. TRM 70361]
MSKSDILKERGKIAVELSDAAHRAYELALSHLAVDPEDIAVELGLPLTAAEAACQELRAMHLLQPAVSQERELCAVNPLSASAQLLSPLQHGLLEHQRSVNQLRQTLNSLLALYTNSAVHQTRLEAAETLSDLGGVRHTITEMAARCTTEVLTCQPGGGRSADVLDDALHRDEAMLRRGVRMRTLYQNTALFSQSTVAYVQRVAALGAHVRTSAKPLTRLIAFDRSSAVISDQHDPQAAVLVRDPSMVAFTVSAFERMWIDSDPFPDKTSRQQARTVTDKHRTVITRMLLDGATDEAIARDLGMSVRTCRRHIAGILKDAGAISRMQAGYFFGLAEERRS